MYKRCCEYYVKCFNKNQENGLCKNNIKRCICDKCIYNRGKEKNDINLKQLEELVALGAVLVDIRSPQEYKEGHLKNAIVIPEYEIRKSAEKIMPNKNRPIIVYCGTGIRSKRAQMLLKRMGYSNVYNLYKGTENY